MCGNLWDKIHDPTMTRAERQFIVEASRRAGKRARARADISVIVHIGVGPGISLHCSRRGMPEEDRLFGVDIAGGAALVGDPDAEIITGLSQGAWQDFGYGIDLLFVDGDHTASAVIGDTVGWRPLVRVGGLVVFHDYDSPYPWVAGVKQAVDTLNWDGWKRVPTPDSLAGFERVV